MNCSYTSTPMRNTQDSQTLGRNLPRNVTFDQLNPVGMVTPISKSRDDINKNNNETESDSVRRSVSTPSNMNDKNDQVPKSNLPLEFPRIRSKLIQKRNTTIDKP